MTAASPLDAAPAPPPRRSDRRDVEGPSREDVLAQAERLADGMRRDARACTRYERWLHALDLQHRDPQLLVEVVLVLAETAPMPPRR